MGAIVLPRPRLRSILGDVGVSRSVSIRGSLALATVLICFAVGATAAFAQSYQTSPPPSNGKFKPSASVRAQQRAAAGLPPKKSSKRTTNRAGTSGTYRPLSTPTITSTSGRAATPKKKSKSRKKRRKPRKETASTYNPPRTTTDIPESPTFVTKVLREVPDGVWAGLLALATLAGALAAGSIASAVRARRMVTQRELLRADVGLLQSALLPSVPERIAGVTVSAAYRPAGGPAAGGDFYDLFPLAN
jgi:hypothetical protein